MTVKVEKLELDYKDRLIPLKLDKVRYIVLHHTASSKASPEDIHRWHLNRGWSGFGYNEYVRKDGSVYIGRGDNVGAHTANMNSISYGICLEGNFDEEKEMSKAQLDALVERIKSNILRFENLKGVARHKDFVNTSCPGKNFSFDEIMEKVNEKEENKLERAVEVLSRNGIIDSPEYWIENAVEGRTVKGEYAAILIERMASF